MSAASPMTSNKAPSAGSARVWTAGLLAVALLVMVVPTVLAQAPPLISIDLPGGGTPGENSVVLEIFLLLTVLSLVPAILVMLTAFTRIIMVLSLLRQAMGTAQMPPNQILIGLALFLTVFVMTPVWTTINQEALQPYLARTLSREQALDKALAPVRRFMIQQTREKDLALFVEIAKVERPKNIEAVPTTVIIPAFIISEIKTAFQIGLLLYVPFLIIDMVVSSVLLSMGMMMLPPVMISLPFKILLFVMVDGWHLLIKSLIVSFK